MQQQIQWTKMSVLIVAFGAIMLIFFQMGKKSVTEEVQSVPVPQVEESADTPKSLQTVTSSESVKTQTEVILYENKIDGYSLEFPKSWEGYTVQDGFIYIPSAPYKHLLDYAMNKIPVLAVVKFSKTEIDTLKPKCQNASKLSSDEQYTCNWFPLPGKPYFLGMNSKYYFNFRGAVGDATINIDDFPLTKKSPELEKLQEETKSVVKSFKSL